MFWLQIKALGYNKPTNRMVSFIHPNSIPRRFFANNFLTVKNCNAGPGFLESASNSASNHVIYFKKYFKNFPEFFLIKLSLLLSFLKIFEFWRRIRILHQKLRLVALRNVEIFHNWSQKLKIMKILEIWVWNLGERKSNFFPMIFRNAVSSPDEILGRPGHFES